MAVASVTILVHLYASWKTFSYSSMQIVVDDPRYPLSKIDFPAVTICSVNKIIYSKAKALILRYELNFYLYFTINIYIYMYNFTLRDTDIDTGQYC